MRRVIVLAVLVAACRQSTSPYQKVGGQTLDVVAAAKDGGVDSGPPAPTGPATMIIGAWNLHDFSKQGEAEARVSAIAGAVLGLDVDALGVEELKLKDDTDASGPQAWDALLAALPGFAGVHAPWSAVGDSTVGLLYRESTTAVTSTETLFAGDTQPFPRPPLRVDLTVTKGGRATSLTVIVLHLKQSEDSLARRIEACEKLDAYVRAEPDTRFLLIGDLNDDPHDLAGKNAFTTSFLNAEPDYHFVTASLPVGTVTSTAGFHVVNGQTIAGELLDHAIVTGNLFADFAQVTPKVFAVPKEEYDSWTVSTSDHFPLVVTFE